MPSIAHIIYIPGILLVGFAFGFRLGARAVRAELERRDQERNDDARHDLRQRPDRVACFAQPRVELIGLHTEVS